MVDQKKQSKKLDSALAHYAKDKSCIVIDLMECTLQSIPGRPERMRMTGYNLDGTKFTPEVEFLDNSRDYSLFRSISGNLFQVPNHQVFYQLTDREEKDMVSEDVLGWSAQFDQRVWAGGE